MKPKIVVGICTGGTIRAETVVSLMSGMINLAQADIPPNLLIQVGGYVDVNRNQIIKEALKAHASHVMFIDADMSFPEDGIARLLAHDKDVVGGNYNVRLDPTSEVLSGPTVKMLVDGEPVSLTKDGLPDSLFKCYAIATGFMLINLRVFDKLDFPYFEAYQDKNGLHYTEDIDFCKKVNAAGLEVWCDPTIQIGHIGSAMY